MNKLDIDNSLRQSHAKIFNDSIGKLPIKLPKLRKNISHVYHLYVIKVDERDDFREYLNSRGIKTSIQYPVPIHLQEFYKKKIGEPIVLPETEKISKQIVSLPMYPELPLENQKIIVDEIKNYFK